MKQRKCFFEKIEEMDIALCATRSRILKVDSVLPVVLTSFQ